MARSTTVSAPGKVLIAGGYLVLDPDYEGTVLATSARFYTTVETSVQVPAGRILVTSPQFDQATWEYDVQLVETSSGSVMTTMPSCGSEKRNKFVEIALREAYKVGQGLIGLEAMEKAHLSSTHRRQVGLSVTILGDNSFYSQRAVLESRGSPMTYESLLTLPRFNSLGVKITEAHKTGLGSSAALIASLVASLLLHFSVISPRCLSMFGDSENISTRERWELDLVHNVAQYVHCLAQGKVGSGFDISSAIYGSQIYRRFNPQIINSLMHQSAATTPEVLLGTLSPSSGWTQAVQPFSLPPYVRLLLADVDAGSDTPSLVGQVLKWRSEQPILSREHWDEIKRKNQQATQCLQDLCQFADSDPAAYMAALQEFTKSSPDPKITSPAPLRKLFETRSALADIRRCMKNMGDAAGVPIEPDEQTGLLDRCWKIPGVIGGGVPGAGGFDALYLLVVDIPRTSTTDEVRKVWLECNTLHVAPIDCQADKGGLKTHVDI